MNNTEAREKLSAGLQVIKAILDTVKEAGRIPAGTLYAGLMAQGCTIQQYQQIENIVTGSGLVEKRNDELIWKG